MIWYIKETDWRGEHVHGPYESKEEAEKIKLKFTKEKNNIRYTVFSREELL